MSFIKTNSGFKNYLIAAFFISLFLSLIFTIFFIVTVEKAIVLDFISLLTGALIIKSGEGNNLYNLETQNYFQQIILNPYGLQIGSNLNLLPYLNFPLLSLLFIPFTYLNFLLAFKIYAVLLFVGLLVISFLSIRIFLNIKFLSFSVFLPFLYYPSLGAALIGQSSILLTLLLFFIYMKLKDRRYLIAGALSGLLLLKIQYIIIVPFILILVKKSEYLKGFIYSSFLIITLSIFLAGPFWSDYVNLLSVAQKPEFGLLDSKLFTLYGSLKQLKPFSDFSFNGLFAFNAVLYLISLFLFARKAKNNKTFDENFIISILLTMVFSVHGVDYDQSILLLPIYILLNLINSKNTTLTAKIAVILIILIPIPLIIGKGIYSSFLLLGTALLLSF